MFVFVRLVFLYCVVALVVVDLVVLVLLVVPPANIGQRWVDGLKRKAVALRELTPIAVGEVKVAAEQVNERARVGGCDS